jgi:hypothetical protein
MSEEKKVDMSFIEDIESETNQKVLMENEIKLQKERVVSFEKQLNEEVDKRIKLEKENKRLECELDKVKDKLYCLAPPLPTDLWQRSKNVWGAALHSHLYGEHLDPGPLSIIERALFDAEKRGYSGRKDLDKVHCNGECSCSSNKESKDETKKNRPSKKKTKTVTRKKK